MKVYLINIDNKFPFLLSQLQAYHQSKGDLITDDDPDIVYISCIFKENLSKANSAASFYPNAKIVMGGAATENNNYPIHDIAKVMPAYDEFGLTESFARTTIGCNNGCFFCVVPKLEGKIKRVAKVEDTHDKRHSSIQIFDNNWIQDKEWFMLNSQYCIDQKLSVTENGIDVRLVDDETAQQLSQIKFEKQIHFAWDFTKQENKVFDGIDTLIQNGVRKYKMMFYVIGIDDLDDLRYRCEKLAELKIDPYVMLFEKWNQPRIMKDYQKFINGHAYKNFTFEEYLEHMYPVQQERQEIELTAF